MRLAPFVVAAVLPLLPVELGAIAPSVTVEDSDGHRRTLPDPARPVAILLEDDEARKRAQPARELFGRYTRRAENAAVFEFVAVADVAKWDWWPAKGYVLKDVRKIEKANHTRVFLDWKGAAKKGWGLRAGSTLLLLAKDGKVLHRTDGPLDERGAVGLRRALSALGARAEDE
jgi:hypothetical protein